MKKVRNISCNELLYTDMQDLTNTYIIQYLFEIDKLKDLHKIEEAFHYAIDICYGSNIFLRNKTYYLKEEKPRIIEKEIKDNDLYNSDFFREKLDYHKESIKIYLLKHKNKNYLVFKFLHSVTDGKGALLFVQNMMNYLKKLAPIECNNTMTDKEFIKKQKNYKKSEAKFPKLINKNSQGIRDYTLGWRVIKLDGYYQAIVSKISCTIAKEFENNSVKIMIPTDLRRYDKVNHYMGNLTLPIFLNVSKDDNFTSINARLLSYLKDRKELNVANASYYGYDKIPKFMRKAILTIGLSGIKLMNKFSVGAIISYLGRINLEDFNNEYISFKDFISMPINQPLGAFAFLIREHSNQTKIVMTYYKKQFSEEYIDEVVDKVKNSINENIYHFNNTEEKYDERNFVKEIEASLNTNKTSIAVIEQSKEYTYDDLNDFIERYNTIFHEKEIGDKIILYIDRGIHYISAIISSIINGITFIPIDKTIKDERINYIIKSSKAKYMITDEKIEFDIKKIITTDVEQKKKTSIPFNYCENNIIYHIYTSGTTGVPKCVPIEARGLNNYLLWCKKTYCPKLLIGMPLFTSLSVDLTITSAFLPLLCGGFIKAYPTKFNTTILKDIFEDSRINVVKLTPTHLSLLLNQKYTVSDKEILIVGGEKVSAMLCKNISSLFHDKIDIYNSYGPAEITVQCTFHKYDKIVDKESVPIGVPISNTKILLYDNEIINSKKRVGEILVSGVGVFGGYPNIDKDCFITINNEKYYCTGDLGYIENGNLYCLGRVDNQVKIHGNRVELDEIVSALNNINEIEDSYIFYKDKLYAFVIRKDNISQEEIINQLGKVLPNYMIPRDIIFIKSFPIKDNGKIDTAELIKNIPTITTKEVFNCNDEIIQLVTEIKENTEVTKDKTLFKLGLESFDIIILIQKLIDKYIDSDKEEKFAEEIISNVETITLNDIEKLIVKFGGKI